MRRLNQRMRRRIGQRQDGELADCDRISPTPQSGGDGLQPALVIADQQQQTGVGLGQRQGFSQHPIEQALEMLFSRERRPNVKKTADSGFHQRHRLG